MFGNFPNALRFDLKLGFENSTARRVSHPKSIVSYPAMNNDRYISLDITRSNRPGRSPRYAGPNCTWSHGKTEPTAFGTFGKSPDAAVKKNTETDLG